MAIVINSEVPIVLIDESPLGEIGDVPTFIVRHNTVWGAEVELIMPDGKAYRVRTNDLLAAIKTRQATEMV